MTNINERIQAIINKLYNGNVSEFERASSIKPSTIKNIVGSRQTKPSYDILELIIRNNVQISAEWLLTGKGEILRNEYFLHNQRTDMHTIFKGDFSEPIIADVKNVKGDSIIGHNNQNRSSNGQSTEESLRAQIELEFLRKENEKLKSLLDQAVADKNKAMDMLDKSLNK